MVINKTVEVTFRTTKEVQMFLMAHPDGYFQLNDDNLISYVTIILSKCGGIYTKAIERCHSNTATDRKIRENFRQNLIAEYESC